MAGKQKHHACSRSRSDFGMEDTPPPVPRGTNLEDGVSSIWQSCDNSRVLPAEHAPRLLFGLFFRRRRGRGRGRGLELGRRWWAVEERRLAELARRAGVQAIEDVLRAVDGGLLSLREVVSRVRGNLEVVGGASGVGAVSRADDRGDVWERC